MSLLAIGLMAFTVIMMVKKIKASPLGSFGVVCAVLYILSHLKDSDTSRVFEVFFNIGLVLVPIVVAVAMWRFRKHKAAWNREFPTPPASNKRRVG